MKNNLIKQRRNTAFLTLMTLSVMAIFLSASPDALALQAGQEMGPSALALHNLINGNVMHAIMIIGIAASVAMSFYKSSFVPVGVGIGTGVLYGFAQTWITATFTVCV